jgi:hypothetical protein
MVEYTEPKYDIDIGKLSELAIRNFDIVQKTTNTSSKESRVSNREKIVVTFVGTGLGRYEAILGSRATAGILISYYPKNKPPYDMLMDPGCRVQERLRELGYNLADTNAVLFTHAHYDHFQQKDQIIEGGSGAALVKGKITIISNPTCLEGSPEEIPEITKYQRSLGTTITLDPYDPRAYQGITLEPHKIMINAHKSMHSEVKGASKVNSYIFRIPTENSTFTFGNISEGPAFKDEKGQWIKDEEGKLKLNEALFAPFIPCDLASVEIGPFTCTGNKLWENHCGFEGAEAILTHLLKNSSPIDIYVEKEWGYEMNNILDEETRKHFASLPFKTFSEVSAYKAYDAARNLGRKDLMVIDAIDKTQIVYYPDTGEYTVRIPIGDKIDVASVLSVFDRKVFPNPRFTLYSLFNPDDVHTSLPVVKEGNTEFIEIDWKK